MHRLSKNQASPPHMTRSTGRMLDDQIQIRHLESKATDIEIQTLSPRALD
jgi:hypothetical protein